MKNYTDIEKIWLWLSRQKYITDKNLESLYKKFGTVKKLENLEKYETEFETIFEKDVVLKIKQNLNEQSAQIEVNYLTKHNIEFVCIESINYPKRFLDFDNMPKILYYIGDVMLLNSRCLSIIGTRNCSHYGELVTEKYSRILAQYGFTIVSGMAEGVDSIAHNTCLGVKGKTIAVLGCGILQINSASQIAIARKITETGLIVSEFHPNTLASRITFPIRNRVIAALGEYIVVTEAGEMSGVRHTIKYASEFAKTVYAVPGNITSRVSLYTNQLIKYDGCEITLTPEDIIQDLESDISLIKNQLETMQLDMDEHIIISSFGANQELHFDEIQNQTKLNTKKLNTVLTNMQLNGILKKIPGNKYMKLR